MGGPSLRSEVLEDFDLALYLLLFDGFEHLDDDCGRGGCIDSFEDL